MIQKIILKSNLSPGDAVTLTVLVESLHKQYPDEYITDVRTSAMEIWENNPFITKLEDNDSETIAVDCHYPTVHESNQRLQPFLYGYLEHFQSLIARPIKPCTNRPCIYLTEEEKHGWVDQVREKVTGGKKVPFWLLNAGVKKDFTCKQWPIEYYQEVVKETRGLIQWVQIGAKEHKHHPISGAIDFRGKTNHREFIRLVYHSQGGLGPSTYLQHLCAAFEKPYLCLLGGREPVSWVQYAKQVTFHTIGQLNCCKNGACWKSRVVALDDKSEQNKSLCEMPMVVGMQPTPKCMTMIKPQEILLVLNRILAC